MTTETVNQENQQGKNGVDGAAGTTGQQASFTTDQVNAIVAERLSRERAKYADYDSLKEKAAKFDAQEESQKTELQKAQDKAAELAKKVSKMEEEEKIRQIRAKVAKESGVPENLLYGSDEETCKSQAEAIKKYAGSAVYPEVKDGGRMPEKGGSGSTAEMFADWFHKSLKQ